MTTRSRRTTTTTTTAWPTGTTRAGWARWGGPRTRAQTHDSDGCQDSSEDLDDDGDGYSDVDETTNCLEGNDPLDDGDYPSDNDGDYSCDQLDADDDNDGFSDIEQRTSNCGGTDPAGPG